MIEGVDYSYDPPSVPGLVAAGKKFVIRYGGKGSPEKWLTATEARDLIAAGIAIVANVEGTTGGLKGGYSAGRDWALTADRFFRGLGMPEDRPIYLSVDFDAGAAHWPALDAAMDGAAGAIGRTQVGVYGGFDTIAHFARNGKARWFWQTYAWSGGIWHENAHIRQRRNGVPLGGGMVDLDTAMTLDYGQWGTRMPTQTDTVVWNTGSEVELGVVGLRDPVKVPANAAAGAPGASIANVLAQTLKAHGSALASLVARPPVDPAALVAALVANDTAMDALATAIAARVGMIPTAGQIAREIGALSWHGVVS